METSIVPVFCDIRKKAEKAKLLKQLLHTERMSWKIKKSTIGSSESTTGQNKSLIEVLEDFSAKNKKKHGAWSKNWSDSSSSMTGVPIKVAVVEEVVEEKKI
jgi:hypothetical protein